MAQNKIVFIIDTETGELVKATQNIKKNTTAIKDQEKTQKKATKTANQFDKQNKSLYQNNLSSAKSFSKMNQTIGGSGGSGALVASYAVLAANVFAVTAAFNTLRTAAASEKLAEGLEAFSNTTGQSLDIVARKLQETTGHAVSFDMAMRTAALSTSAGFGVAEMEGLTRVAKGASLALGRDMGDALDRLTRGAIKLEPEILDELGIMVRLDDATETYAAQLGKAATQLTRFERQQAFMNAIITEGETKFGDIADSIDPNSYDKLSAAFADLAREGLNLLNGLLIPLINFLTASPGVFLGAVLALSGGITKRIIPALGNMSAAALASAQAARNAASDALAGQTTQIKEARNIIGPIDGINTKYNELIGSYKDGQATQKDVATLNRSLNASIGSLEKKKKDLGKENKRLTRSDAKLLKTMKQQKEALGVLKNANMANVDAMVTEVAMSEARVAAKTAEAAIIETAGQKTYTYTEALMLAKTVLFQTASATYNYVAAQFAAINSSTTMNTLTKFMSKALAVLKGAFFGAGLGAKAFGTMLLNAIPIIGQIILFASFAIDMLKGMLKFFGIGTDEQVAAKEALADLNSILDDIPDKMEELNKQQERASHTTQLMINRYKVLGGLLKTVLDQAIEAEKKAVDAGNYQGFFGAINKQLDTSETGDESAAKLLGRAEDISPMIKAVAELNRESEDFAKFLQSKINMPLEDFIREMSLGTMEVEEMSNALRALLIEGEIALNGLAQSALGLTTTFQEAEKVTQKFFRGMVQSTKFDEVSKQFKTLSNDIAAVIREAEEAGEDPLAFIGEAATKGLGKGITALMGPEAVAAVEQQKKVQQEIATVQQKLAKETSSFRRKALEDEIEILQGKYKKANEEVAKVIQEELPLQSALLENLIKRTLVTEKEIKFLEQRKKGMLAMAKNEFTILAAKSIDDANNTKRIELLKLELSLKAGVVAEAKAQLALGKVLSKEQADALANEKFLLEEIEMLQNSIQNSAVTIAEARLASLKTSERELKITQDIAKITLSNAEKLAKLQNLIGGTTISKVELANLEVDAATQGYNLEVQKTNMAMNVLRAEFDLLEAQGKFETQKNNAKLIELKAAKAEQDAIAARINELDDMGAREFIGGPVGGGGYVGRTTEQQAELEQLQAKVDDTVDKSITALTEVNSAISTTYDTQLDALELTAEKSAQTIIGAALDAELGVKQALGDLGKGFLQQNAGVGLADAIMTAMGPSKIAQVKEDLKAEIDKLDPDGDGTSLVPSDQAQLNAFNEAYSDLVEKTKGKNFELANSFSNLGIMIGSMFGEDGAMLAGMSNLTATMLTSFDTMEGGFRGLQDTIDTETGETITKQEQLAEKLGAIGNIIGSIGQLAATSAKQRVAGVDKEIEAEKKRDGKSKESLAKIAGLEKKKEAIERKAFERNKKIQMAQVIINTAAGIMKTIGQTGFFGLPLALIIGAMGAAQLSMIAGTSFEGGGTGSTPNIPSSIEVGKRDNKVDVSRGATTGETAYLRGAQGIGTNANQFSPIGGAAGMKSYASGGEILVGERGPEVVTPLAPVEVTANDKLGGTTNVNFSINAVDAAGVEDLLTAQRGNIIGMIREAANEHGQEFMEEVNTGAY